MLFQKKIPEACAMTATSDQIYLGLFDGSIISLDPISQNSVHEHRHSDIITSLSEENGVLLSSSMDGSIFYNYKMPISEAGVLNCKLIGEEKFFCSCSDNSLVLADKATIKTFIGHKDIIKSLSYNKFGISSSREGTVGFLIEEQIFETELLGISHHYRLNLNQFIGYGLGKVALYDTNLKTEVWSIPENSLNLDVKDSLLAYSFDKNIKLRDIRSKDSLNILLNANITD